jgi:methylaspartate mutase epsilon subunit
MGIKDIRGAIRWQDFINLPFPEEIKVSSGKVAERENEGRKMDYEVLVQDFWAFSKGQLVGRHRKVPGSEFRLKA